MTTPTSSPGNDQTGSDPAGSDPQAPSGPDPADGMILAPRPWVPLGLIAIGLALLLLQRVWSWTPIAAGVVGLLGLVLLLQTLLLRLQFSGDALLVWSRSTLLRRFPYSEWIGWTLFWGPLPVLFYFRERRSPHLLPVLFDANALRQQLELHLSGLP